jgi:hypothetical protein
MNCLFIQTCSQWRASSYEHPTPPNSNTPAPAPPLTSSGKYVIIKPFVCASVYCLSTAVATLPLLHATPFAAAPAAAKLCACFVNCTASFAVVAVHAAFNARAKYARAIVAAQFLRYASRRSAITPRVLVRQPGCERQIRGIQLHLAAFADLAYRKSRLRARKRGGGAAHGGQSAAGGGTG